MAERAGDAQAASRRIPLAALQEKAAARRESRSLIAALSSGPAPRIIAEVKRASPSAGVLRKDYRPAEIAEEYESCGAAAISVLTEPRHFLGSIDDLKAVRGAVRLPVLRKDFICEPYQVYEAAANGADAVLLICAALTDEILRELYETALSAGLETVAEAHSAEELQKALRLEQAIVGINSRNLKTLKTDLASARELAGHVPRGRVAMAESGIRTRADIEALSRLGYKGFLIGETLMRSPDIAAALRGLLI